MNGESLCTATFFVPTRMGSKDRKDVYAILGQFGVSIKDSDESLQFDLTGYEFDKIREDLVDKIAEYLDMSRRSSLMYFGDDGELCTAIIQDGEVLYA